LFDLSVTAGKPLRAVPILFFGVILISGLLGAIVARYYSEPLNRALRQHWGNGPDTIGSVIEAPSASGGDKKLE
jgi:hypothetical protein